MISDKAGGSTSTSSADPTKAAKPAWQSEAIARLEQLSRHDPGGRGLPSTAPAGLLEPAALTLLASSRVIIVTGFCVRSAMIGETDGPSGASALAACLLGLGKKVTILTDKYSSNLVASALAVHSPPAGTDPGLPISVVVLPDDDGNAAQACMALAHDFEPDLIIAVERPGTAEDGHRYSMRGTILDDIAPPADILFTASENRRWTTAAIGDGGNELGMGSLRDTCVSAVTMGEQIFCTSNSDFPVAAGISNWGAYALAGAVSILAGRAVLPSPEEELSSLQAVYKAGGVDGATREHTCTVDSLPADEYLHTIRQMNKLVMESL
ncbi:MAG: DUF4392 domain-containing protein [Spirochaetota bacterium]